MRIKSTTLDNNKTLSKTNKILLVLLYVMLVLVCFTAHQIAFNQPQLLGWARENIVYSQGSYFLIYNEDAEPQEQMWTLYKRSNILTSSYVDGWTELDYLSRFDNIHHSVKDCDLLRHKIYNIDLEYRRNLISKETMDSLLVEIETSLDKCKQLEYENQLKYKAIQDSIKNVTLVEWVCDKMTTAIELETLIELEEEKAELKKVKKLEDLKEGLKNCY